MTRPKPNSSATNTRNSFCGSTKPIAISGSCDSGAGQQHGPDEHPEGRTELLLVAGEDCVGAEETEWKNDEQDGSEDIPQPAQPVVIRHGGYGGSSRNETTCVDLLS